MVAIVGIFGLLQIVAGILIYFIARSPTDEIVSAVVFGTGVIALALGVIIERLDEHHNTLQRIAVKI